MNSGKLELMCTEYYLMGIFNLMLWKIQLNTLSIVHENCFLHDSYEYHDVRVVFAS